jgi:type VI protein secretion system component Hcp
MFNLVRIKGVVTGDRCILHGYEKDWFVADSVDYGVSYAHPMKPSVSSEASGSSGGGADAGSVTTSELPRPQTVSDQDDYNEMIHRELKSLGYKIEELRERLDAHEHEFRTTLSDFSYSIGQRLEEIYSSMPGLPSVTGSEVASDHLVTEGAADSGGNSQAVTATFGKLVISKVIDGVTPQALFTCCKGQRFASVEVQIAETSPSGTGVYPIFMMRFGEVFLESWNIGLDIADLTETLTFSYRQVACEFLRTKDGKTYEKLASEGWELVEEDGQVKGREWDYQFKLRGVS